MYKRLIQDKIESWLFKGKIMIIYGPRQVGKTTLSKQILTKFGADGLYLNCETPTVVDILNEANPDKILSGFLGKKIVVLDEAQTIENIGRKLKVFVDKYPEIQIIATGSSSFDLSNKINEPLTGRSVEWTLWPLSAQEIISHDGLVEYKNNEEWIFRFGTYPQVYSNKNNEEVARTILENIQTNYLYKDILMFENLKKPALLTNLLKKLALQVGSEVSYNSLANDLDTSTHTVSKYIDLLEKVFIIKKLYAFSNNKDKELRKGFKVYFLDLGLRNVLIQNTNFLQFRDDVGKIFENYFIIERIKSDLYSTPRRFKNYYFWRTYDQKEIDLIEEFDGKILALECKYGEGNFKEVVKNSFLNKYKNSSFLKITKVNYIDNLK